MGLNHKTAFPIQARRINHCDWEEFLVNECGLSIRQLYAAIAMHSITTGWLNSKNINADDIAMYSFSIADQMISYENQNPSSSVEDPE